MTAFQQFAAAGALIAIGFFLALAIPIMRRVGPRLHDGRAAALQDRLGEIDRQRAGAMIGDAEAESAILEAKRAALTAPPHMAERSNRLLRLAAVAFLALSPVAVAVVYMKVGAPALIDPAAIRTAAPNPETIAAMPEEERRAMIESMVAGLAARLERSPDDAAGWRMLARSQLVLERPVESAASYRRLIALEEGTVDDWRGFAAALIAAYPEGRFPTDAEFLRALDEIEQRAPGDPMALFYRGGAAHEAGDPARAVALWSALLGAMPADAPVRATLERLIADARAETAKP